jgi:S1-C subfamily serine protease
LENIIPDSAAAEAGLAVNDKVTSINGLRVKKFHDLVMIVGSFKAGEEISISFERDGESMTTKAVLKDRNLADQ